MLAFQYEIVLPNEIIVPKLIAIAEHDDGVKEKVEDKNLTEAGAARNFLVSEESKKIDLKQQYNVMKLATSKIQLNALLTSTHINFIFGDKVAGENKKLDVFLKEQEKNRKQILKHLVIDKKYADRLYRFVE